MRALVQLVAAPPARPGGPTRLERMAGQAPIAWRNTPDAVYLVSTSATPVGDDDVVLDVRARAGSQMAVRSTAATVAWAGRSSCQEVRVTVEGGSSLDWAPEPLIATARCRHRQIARVDVHAGGSLRWREILVLGRHGEDPGLLHSVLSVDVGSRPLLRHELAVGAAGWNGPAVVGSSPVVGLLLLAGAAADVADAGGAAGEGWSSTPLEGPGVLACVVARTVSEAERRLEEAIRSSTSSRIGGMNRTSSGYNC